MTVFLVRIATPTSAREPWSVHGVPILTALYNKVYAKPNKYLYLSIIAYKINVMKKNRMWLILPLSNVLKSRIFRIGSRLIVYLKVKKLDAMILLA